VGADASYLWLLSSGEADRLDEEAEAVADLATLRATMVADGVVWQRVLARELDPDALLVRHRDDGSSFSAPLGIRLAQVVHHGTDHRSQVCTALTALGITPPEIDVWDFAAVQGRAFEAPATEAPRPEAPAT
jgi:uncharacterized damage-inducible protein DinB